MKSVTGLFSRVLHFCLVLFCSPRYIFQIECHPVSSKPKQRQRSMRAHVLNSNVVSISYQFDSPPFTFHWHYSRKVTFFSQVTHISNISIKKGRGENLPFRPCRIATNWRVKKWRTALNQRYSSDHPLHMCLFWRGGCNASPAGPLILISPLEGTKGAQRVTSTCFEAPRTLMHKHGRSSQHVINLSRQHTKAGSSHHHNDGIQHSTVSYCTAVVADGGRYWYCILYSTFNIR